jgi:hypothetical protein
VPRPRHRGNEGPTTLVPVRFTATELAALDRARGGQSRSDLVREAVAALAHARGEGE